MNIRCVCVCVCVCVCSCLFEFFQGLLRPKNKLQRDVLRVTVWSATRVHNMPSDFLQCSRGDCPRVKQR